MRHHQGVDLTPLQHGADALALFEVADAHPFRLDGQGLGPVDDPVDLAPGHVVFRLQVPFGEHGKGGLERAEPHVPADEIPGRLDAGVDVYPHLRQAEQAARKDRDGLDGHATALGDQVGRQRELGDVELAVPEHALVAPVAVSERMRLAHLQHLQVQSFRGHASIEQRHVPVIVGQGYAQFGIRHDVSCLLSFVVACNNGLQRDTDRDYTLTISAEPNMTDAYHGPTEGRTWPKYATSPP